MINTFPLGPSQVNLFVSLFQQSQFSICVVRTLNPPLWEQFPGLYIVSPPAASLCQPSLSLPSECFHI